MGSMQAERPINMPLTGAKSDLGKEGLVLFKNSGANTLELSTTVDDAIVAVLDQPVVDITGTVKATRTGESKGVYPVGSGKIVYVSSLDAQTYTIGAAVYNAQTASTAGCVGTSSAASATKIGHYIGSGVLTVADYELIPVILDVASIN